MTTEESVAIDCPRCRAVQKEVRLMPVEESLRMAGSPSAEPPADDRH
jgi:hypothetical protein